MGSEGPALPFHGGASYSWSIKELHWIVARSSLVRRFFIVFLLAIAVPVFVIGIAITVGYRRFSLELAASRAANALAPLAQGIDEEARRAALLAATLSTDQQFVTAAVSLNAVRNPRDEYEISSRIDDRLSAFFNYTNKIGAILLYFRDRPVFLLRNNRYLFDRPLDKGTWYETVTAAPDATIIMGDFDNYGLDPVKRPLLKVAVCPSRDSLNGGFQAMVVAFRVPFLDRIVESDVGSFENELLLVDGEGTVILAGRPEKIGTRIDPSLLSPSVFKAGGSTFLSSTASIPAADWTLISVTDYSRVMRDIDAFAGLARWVLLALLLAFAVYIEVFFRQLIHPIRTIIGEMGRVEQGNWDIRVKESGPAELSQLSRSFNTMVSEVKRLTAERELQERERARLELEALRLQINPHFLTNTLNSIKMMAAISNAEPIRRMTSALMRVVSSSFRDGDSPASLGEELEILEQYLLIMRVRYGDTFDVRIEVPGELRGLSVLRMLLQPMVENSILHGLQGLDRRGEITIRGRIESPGAGSEALVLEVRDNGRGAAQDKLAQALAGSPERHHGMTSIGLANIQRRITLNHGSGYGLVVETETGRGTTVTLRLPVIRAG